MVSPITAAVQIKHMIISLIIAIANKNLSLFTLVLTFADLVEAVFNAVSHKFLVVLN